MHDLKVLTQSTMGSPCWTHLGPRCHSLEPLAARCVSRGPLGKEPWTRGSPEGPSLGKLCCGRGGGLGLWRVEEGVLAGRQPLSSQPSVALMVGDGLEGLAFKLLFPLSLSPSPSACVCMLVLCVFTCCALSLVKWEDFFQNTIHKGFKSGRVIINIRHFSLFLPFEPHFPGKFTFNNFRWFVWYFPLLYMQIFQYIYITFSLSHVDITCWFCISLLYSPPFHFLYLPSIFVKHLLKPLASVYCVDIVY